MALTQQQVMLTTQRMDVWIPSTAPLRRCGGCGGNRAKRRVCQQAVHPILGVDNDSRQHARVFSGNAVVILISYTYIYIYIYIHIDTQNYKHIYL